MKLLIALMMILPAVSFSADFVNTKPNVLELRKYRTVSGKLELRYMKDNPRIVMRIGAGNKATNDFFEKLMKSDIAKLNCDGDFFPMFDQFGMQYMHVNSLKACVDEEGDVIAHSINMSPIGDSAVATSKQFITENMKPVTAVLAPNINNSTTPKEVVDEKAGVFSPKLIKTLQK